ncbi:hypothetical protein [Capsulimonas corticalis]|nr:hypothetical protein [Capsulimonas corticalis]
MQENLDDFRPEEWLADTCFGIACFCGSITVSLATHYMAAFLIVLVSLPLITAPRSQMCRAIGAGALVGVASLFLIGLLSTSFPH